MWDNEEALDSTYDGGDITFDKRLSNGWMFTGGVSIGKNIGDIYPSPTDSSVANDLNNPNFTYRRGVSGNDVPFSLRLSSVYELPYGISASGTFQRQTGFPGDHDGVGGKQHHCADARQHERCCRTQGHGSTAAPQ